MDRKYIVTLVIILVLIVAGFIWAFSTKEEPAAQSEPTPTELTQAQKDSIWDLFVKENDCTGEEATTTMTVHKMSEEGRQIEVAEGTDFWYCKGLPMVY